MIVTTSFSPDLTQIARAQALADEFQVPYLPRERLSIEEIQRCDINSEVLLVTKRELLFHRKEQHPVFFHPSLAVIRIKRIINGEQDVLQRVGRVEAGHHIIDCTAGFGSDAIVFAYLVGEHGKVIALESQALLATITREGLRHYDSQIEACNQAMRKVELLKISHVDFLRKQPNQSVDIIYFDPMFRQPYEDSHAISAIRQLANHEALCSETIAHAKRIARKRVILKESRRSPEFARLGISRVTGTHSRIAYGVIELDIKA